MPGSSRQILLVALILVILFAIGLIVYASPSSSIFNNVAFVTLLAAVLGSVATLVGTSLISQFQSPQLSVDFKSHNEAKPYFDILGLGVNGMGTQIKFLRLVVANGGRSPAKRCEAKLTWEESGIKQPFQVIPHWVRLEPLTDKWSRDIYSPITINTRDNEELDLLKLVQGQQEIRTVSVKEAAIRPNTAYDLTVSVFSSNSNPYTLRFSINWDGTWDGFDKSVNAKE